MEEGVRRGEEDEDVGVGGREGLRGKASSTVGYIPGGKEGARV